MEIEGHINRVLKFLKLAKHADQDTVMRHIKELKQKAQQSKKDQQIEDQQKENEKK